MGIITSARYSRGNVTLSQFLKLVTKCFQRYSSSPVSWLSALLLQLLMLMPTHNCFSLLPSSTPSCRKGCRCCCPSSRPSCRCYCPSCPSCCRCTKLRDPIRRTCHSSLHTKN